MPKRTICVQRPSKLSVSHHSLRIKNDKNQAEIPLEDIWVVILETHQALVTTSALSSLADSGIGVMFCGDDHMPNGLLLPLGAHSRHAEIVDDQLAISKPLKKRLWQRIVVQKIINQSTVLDLFDVDPEPVKKYAAQVLSGDTTNRESAAAAAYFRRYIPVGRRRTEPCSPALDYGYAVLRAGIGRTAVSGGWLVSRGIHHHNSLNAFNLVDDLIEPFRPILDLLVRQQDLFGNLTPEKKATIASIFSVLVSVNGATTTVQSAIETELETLKQAVQLSDPKLFSLPGIIPLQFASRE